MSTLAEILDEMGNAIRKVIDNTTDVDVQVEPRMVLDPTPPCVDMYPSDPSNDQALAGFGEDVGGELITIRVRVSTADHEAGQDLLLALMDDEDPLSVITALLDEPTLNGLCSTIYMPSRSGYMLFPVPDGGALIGCLLNVVAVKARS